MRKALIKKEGGKYIKRRKGRLGFSEWTVIAKTKTFVRKDDYPQDGDFTVRYAKKQATIFIGTIQHHPIEEIVVHELIHILLWPIDQAAISFIKSSSHSQTAKEQAFLGKLEKVVAQLTKSHSKKRNVMCSYPACPNRRIMFSSSSSE